MSANSSTLALLRRSLADGQATALAVHVRAHGAVVCDEALGFARQYQSPGPGLPLVTVAKPEAVSRDHLFDTASMSKVLATTLAALALISDGKLRLDHVVHELLPVPPAPGRTPLQVWHLLTHRSGLPAWLPLYFDVGQRTDLLAALAPYLARAVPGEGRLYSDLGYLLLGALVEERAGCGLEAYLQARAWEPLGLRHTCYNPRRRGRSQVVATGHANIYERRMIDEPSFGLALPPSWHARPSHAFGGWRNRTVHGDVDDGNAHYAMAGVAGHAGQFSNAADVTALCRAMAGPPGCAEVRALRLDEGLRQRFLRRHACGDYLGWFPGAELAPEVAPKDCVMVRGFTGTVVVACPARDLHLTVLGNREHPSADGHYVNLRPLFAEVLRTWLQADGGRP